MIEFELLAMVVEDVTGASKEELISKRRPRPLVELRMICSNILKENHRSLSVEKIGAFLNINHATVTYHRKTHKTLLGQRDGKYKLMYEKINEKYLQKLFLSGAGKTKTELLEKKQRLQIMISDIDNLIKTFEEKENV